MRRDVEGTPSDIMTERLRLLPRRLRVAHLRVLIGRQFAGSNRGRELATLLRDQLMAQAAEEGGLA